jgi:prepilin-type N-terminal cleavage/methylation domain-containing protein
MKTKAFTLIELLIVVAIIAILAAIAVPNFLEAQTRSKISRVKADMRTIATALEMYYTDYSKNIKGYAPWSIDHAPQHIWLRMEWQDGKHRDPPYDEYWGRPLTTPVAYITSVPFDPFTTVAWGKQPQPWWPSKPRNTSCMIAYGSEWDWPRDIYGGSDSGNPIINPNVGWVMYSAGPACYLAWSPPVGYDPTNGTTSVGNIFYVRGAGFQQKTGMQ